MEISFHFQAPASLQNRKALKQFLSRLAIREGRKLDTLIVVFCTDYYLLEINRTYLKHDFYTDIITFDLGKGAKDPIEGEIYISIDRVKENASMYKSTIRRELHRVLFHGVLHLCGYKDKSVKESRIMKGKEEEYLTVYFQ